MIFDSDKNQILERHLKNKLYKAKENNLMNRFKDFLKKKNNMQNLKSFSFDFL